MLPHPSRSALVVPEGRLRAGDHVIRSGSALDPVDASRSALVVMDYQTAILADYPQADTLVSRTAAAIRVCRSAHMRIVFVRVAYTDQDLSAVSPRNKSYAILRNRDVLVEGSPGAQIDPRLTPNPQDVVVTKTRVGAFSTTPVDFFLRAHRVDTLVLCGLSTSGVVLSTVRAAADRDYRLLVLSDCCQDRNPEVHRVLMDHVLPVQADVTDVEALTTMIR